MVELAMSKKLATEQLLALHLGITATEVQSDPELQDIVNRAVVIATRRALERAEANKRVPYADLSTEPTPTDLYHGIFAVAGSLKSRKK